MVTRRDGALLLPILLGASACAEAVPVERAQLEEARRALERKDFELRGSQWQLASVVRQLQDSQLKGEVTARELQAQLRELTAANATLTERLRHLEGERDAVATTAGKPSRESLDVARRALAASEAQSARIARLTEQMERLTKLLASRSGDGDPPAQGRAATDLIDPWGFGSRK